MIPLANVTPLAIVNARSNRRAGFSLIEMITALLAATVLMSALAASIVISTTLLESPPTESDELRERMIGDRLRRDLRYAIQVDDSRADGFQIVRPNPTTGVAERISYASEARGFTRQVGSEPITVLNDQAPAVQWLTDELTPSYDASASAVARVCATSRASTSGSATSLTIPVPPGLKSGDHGFLCLSAMTPDSLSVDQPGWQAAHARSISDLRLVVMHQAFDDSWPTELQITISPASAVAAVLVAVEQVDTTAPVSWTTAASGYAFSFYPYSHPTFAEDSGITSGQLNLQVYAAEDDPWYEGMMGMAGFSDVIHETAASGSSRENSIGVVVRNGPAPELDFTPRLLYWDSGFWIRASLHVEATP